jgi:hypothetical protein
MIVDDRFYLIKFMILAVFSNLKSTQVVNDRYFLIFLRNLIYFERVMGFFQFFI